MNNELTIKMNLYPDHVERDAEWVRVARELYETKMALKRLAQQEKMLTDRLKALSEQHSARGGKYVFTKSERKGPIDYKLAEKVLNVDFEPYRKSAVETWKLEAVIMPEGNE